jgi:hypothetical protein
MNEIKINIIYRDADNYKTFFDHTIDVKEYPEAKNLKVGSEFNMGEYGTLTENEFFNSEIHPHNYDHSADHNILEVYEMGHLNIRN